MDKLDGLLRQAPTDRQNSSHDRLTNVVRLERRDLIERLRKIKMEELTLSINSNETVN